MTTLRDKRRRLAVVAAADITPKVLLIAQIEAAQRAGYEVHVICTPGPHFPWLAERGVKLHGIEIRRSISPFPDLLALWSLYRCFRRERIDIVHTHTPKVSLLGQLAARLAGVPIIVNTIHGFYFHEHMKPMPRRFYIAMEWVAARCSTAILCQNPEDIETAVRLGICRRETIRLLGNGINLERFDPAQFDTGRRARLRDELGLPQDAVVVGIIGRLVREKGYLELFTAMRTLMAENPRLWLLIIGPEEPDKPDRISRDALAAYGIAERTRWLGSRDDIPELLACCDVYTLPSWREGFPRSAIEAAAMGLPIVATDIRGCRQVVREGENGLLVPLRDVAALERTLRELCGDPTLRQAMGAAGRKRALAEFDERQVCEIVLDTYRREEAARAKKEA